MEVPLDALVHRTTQVTYQHLSQLVDSLQSKRCAAAQHPYALYTITDPFALLAPAPPPRSNPNLCHRVALAVELHRPPFV